MTEAYGAHNSSNRPQAACVDVLGDLQAVAAGRGQPDQLLQPRRAGRLQMHAGVEFPQRFVHRPIERELVAARMHAELQVLGQLKLAHGEGDHGQVVLELAAKLGHVADVIDALVEPAANRGAIVCAGMPSSATAARITSSSTGVCGRSVSSIETSITERRAALASAMRR